MNTNKYIHQFAICLLLFLTMSCHDRVMEEALKLSGSNRGELEKVLAHFKYDDRKYQAACFLIANMPGAFGPDKTLLPVCTPFYRKYDSISHTFNYDSLSYLAYYSRMAEWGSQIDSLWKQNSNNLAGLSHQQSLDLTTITADRLITEIEQSFAAWKENVYTRNASFEDFCEYILPYRRINGLLVDSARQVFYARHRGEFFTTFGKDIIDEADSLLYRYKQIAHSQFYAMNIPIFDAGTLEYLRHGLCEHRCWYNSLLFSSLGMAVAIDFIPSWGNRKGAHSWNVLIKDGQSYPFEPFWDEDRWKYKRVYNNRSYDEVWGRFRLPKVFRHTYRRYVEGPLADGTVALEDIPELFRNVRKKDVSHEYFDTTHVSVTLQNIPHQAKFAYLCVYHNDNNWRPVEWGKIENGVARFEGMGRDIVYLPTYYTRGVLQPAASPFLLRSDGTVQELSSSERKQEIVLYHRHANAAYRGSRESVKKLEGTILLGGTQPGIWTDTLCLFSSDMENYTKKVALKGKHSIRYVRLLLPEKQVSLGSLLFHKQGSAGPEKLTDVRIMKQLPLSATGESADNILDRWPSTGYKQKVSDGYIDFDLGEKCRLAHVVLGSYLKNYFPPGSFYELYYWKNGWQLLQQAMGEQICRFTNVPENTLLIVWKGEMKDSRIFTYENDEVFWH